MKLSSVATLWDYINRAMPWNKPKSLSTEEVYAVSAYMLNMAGVVPDDYVLSNSNMAEVQERLPNRKGMTTEHSLWPGPELKGSSRIPDVAAVACMTNCPVDGKVASMLPEFARNAHGNLAEQNRQVGAQRGADTTRQPSGSKSSTGQPPPAQSASLPSSVPSPPHSAGGAPSVAIATELLQKNSCTACHAANQKLVGPSWSDISKKHAGKADYLAGKIKNGSVGVWGNMPMPPQALPVEDAKKIAEWLASAPAR